MKSFEELLDTLLSLRMQGFNKASDDPEPLCKILYIVNEAAELYGEQKYNTGYEDGRISATSIK